MKYFSTRDPNKKKHSFSDVLLAGLAPDGGLYVPEYYPEISRESLSQFHTKSYGEIAQFIFPLFVGDSIPHSDLSALITKTYTAKAFKSDAITPIEELRPGLFLQDLSQGPSLAFKDLAMQFLGHAMDYELNRQSRKLIILGASSGDTVSAAEEAMKGKSNISVVMLTPKSGMSPFQKAQAGSILAENIYNVSIPGPFDLCQDIIKTINQDIQFKETYSIGAVNSINWGRICAQIIYYFVSWARVSGDIDRPIDVVVPSGNFGNVLAGYIAKMMGAPIRKLIVSTNENKVLHTFFQTGDYEQLDVQITSSPSMDISKASNIERYFFDLLKRDPIKLAQLMETFQSVKKVSLRHLLDIIQEKDEFFSGMANHVERLECIQAIYKTSQRIIDPHTAAGVKTALDFQDKQIPIVCMETAKPAKFEHTIKEALGFIPNRPEEFIGLEDKEQRFYESLGTVDAVQSFIKSNF